ncbi:hypothetical protein LSAT2_009534, partial [Lamellibrachia satsuma]
QRDSVAQDATVSPRTRQCHLGRDRVTKDAAMPQRTRLCHTRRDSVTEDATVSHRTRQFHTGCDSQLVNRRGAFNTSCSLVRRPRVVICRHCVAALSSTRLVVSQICQTWLSCVVGDKTALCHMGV